MHIESIIEQEHEYNKSRLKLSIQTPILDYITGTQTHTKFTGDYLSWHVNEKSRFSLVWYSSNFDAYK